MVNPHATQVTPVEVIFDGCHPDKTIAELCMTEARTLHGHSHSMRAFVVTVAMNAARVEIRVSAETAAGELSVAGVAPASDRSALRASLRRAFIRLARALQAREASGVRAPAIAWSGAGETSIWYG